ncbi:MAG TPA: hypothetical protein DHV28_13320 [Ignavibacteriales bacterium]|nr:hypothetical protein [Ignavibacteriales bacterium]
MKQNKHFTTIFFALILSIVFYTSSTAQVITCNIQACIDYYGSQGYTSVTSININSGNLNLTPLSSITSVTGDLIIHSTTGMTSLNGLNNITSVGGNIEIWGNDALTNLAGLENLTSVGGYIYIAYNTELTSFEGLGSLTSFDRLIIQENPALTNLSGLENLTSVSGSIEISGNAAITNLIGLENVTSVGGNLYIAMNDALTDLEGLGSLTTIGGDLSINNNHIQTDLYGLESLTTVNGKFDIQNNESMTNVDGLESLTTVGGNFQLWYSNSLTNLDGLGSLTSVSGEMYISNNPQLVNFCGLYPLFTTGAYNYVNIYSNGILFPGPSSAVEQIIALGPCVPDVTVVSLDIFPTTCPNQLNVKAKGVISVAILGTDDFDVQNIDPATLLLEGLSPFRWENEDVTTPISNGEQCDCTIDGPDGFDDLTLKFDAKSLIGALGEVNNGDELVLTITGNLVDGTAIEGSDCVIIAGKKLNKDVTENVPEEYALFENYPNPFNPSTTINYQLADQGYVSLIVYDLLGREVATLVNEVKQSGYYQVEFNAADLPSGVYMYRIEAGSYVQTKKMMLLK